MACFAAIITLVLVPLLLKPFTPSSRTPSTRSILDALGELCGLYDVGQRGVVPHLGLMEGILHAWEARRTA